MLPHSRFSLIARAADNFAVAAFRDGFPPLRTDRALDIIQPSQKKVSSRYVVEINMLLSANAVPLSAWHRRLLARRGSPAIGALVPVAGHGAHLDQLAVLARQAEVYLVVLEEVVGDGDVVCGLTGGGALVVAVSVQPPECGHQREEHKNHSPTDNHIH